jgi:hypothetical protein
MEEAPENGKESSHSARANGMNKWIIDESKICVFLGLWNLPLAVISFKARTLRQVGTKISVINDVFIFYSEDGSSIFNRNVGKQNGY